jgi:hypothetical protein
MGKQARVAAPAKKVGRSPQGTQHKSSDFVRLAQLIVTNGFAFNTFNDFGVNAFDPAITDRILVTGDTRWAFGRIETNRHRPENFPETDPSRHVIGIQALHVDHGIFNPFFGELFRPVSRRRLLLTAEDLALLDGIAPLTVTGESTQDIGESGTDFTVGTDRSPLAYRYAMDKRTSINAGFSLIHDLSDTTGMAQALEDPENQNTSATSRSGVNLSLGARYKAVTLTGGYIRALDSRTSAELALEDRDGDPIAWNSEIAYSTELLRRETTLAVGYQKSSDALHDYLPEERYRTRASMALSDSTTFSLEYYQDREYATRNGEEDGYGITTRIGFDF